MKQFSALFQPGEIGTLHLKNRLVMPAMGTQLAHPDGTISDRLIDYYRARAVGGVAMIIPQFAAVSPDSRLPFSMALDDDTWIEQWRVLVTALHEAGAKCCIQLMHVGLIYLYIGEAPGDVSIPVPSITPWLQKTGFRYRELTEKDIRRYVEDFGHAARRAKEAGADAIELHACHGCLVGSFLSPATNRRRDQYGGGVENRTRFARVIMEHLRHEVGGGFPLLVRINASDDVEGGITPDEAIQQALILESAGADSVSISAGLEYWSSMTSPCYLFPDGPTLPFVESIKKAVKIPVVAAGKINAELAARIVGDGKADFIALGRPLLADPELPNKISEGRMDELRRCIYCNNCLKRDPQAGPGSCTVNPYLYREAKYPPAPTGSPKTVMVVGGGIGGMQTALFLAQRGHTAYLYEKSNRLGGQWAIACATPGKEPYGSFLDYLKRSLEKCRVTVNLGVEVTREKVVEVKPDAVVLATGAIPMGLGVPGATNNNVFQGHDVIGQGLEPEGRVVVIGGRFIGMELAAWLAGKGQSVSLVTRAGLGEDGIKLEKFTFVALARKLLDLHVALFLNSTVVEITQKSVVVSMSGGIYALGADTVILAVGMESDNRLAQHISDVVPELYAVGDCVRPRDAAEVAYQAARVASKI